MKKKNLSLFFFCISLTYKINQTNRQMAKQLCKSHVTQLSKVQRQLALNQKMDCTQLILGEVNKDKVEKAKKLIGEAMILLNEVVCFS